MWRKKLGEQTQGQQIRKEAHFREKQSDEDPIQAVHLSSPPRLFSDRENEPEQKQMTCLWGSMEAQHHIPRDHVAKRTALAIGQPILRVVQFARWRIAKCLVRDPGGSIRRFAAGRGNTVPADPPD
jgi:hypothetical protein